MRISDMDQIRRHFEDEAHEFDRIVRNNIPYYEEMLEALIAALPFERSAPIAALDIGCGTGSVAEGVLKAFPRASVTCLDFAERMIDMARVKLSPYSGVRYLTQDFRDFDFDPGYDVIVSSLALHHLETDDAKRDFYKKVNWALKPGGCFYNADVVLASADALQTVYLEKWKSFMRRRIPEEEIEQIWLPKYRSEDRPARLLDQLSWLETIGFQDIDVIWKYYNFAVYGGVKASRDFS